MIIELQRAHTPEDAGREEECGLCSKGFRSGIVLAFAWTDCRRDVGLLCPGCVALMGRYRPDRFPTAAEHEAAAAAWLTPIWGSVEEATRAWGDRGYYCGLVEANRVKRRA